MSDEQRLDGLTVAITGGAGGIGMATAKALVGAGAKVAIGDLEEDASVEAAAALGEGHFGAALDVTDIASFENFVDRAEAELGPLYGLINNAGVMILGPLDEEDPKVTETTIAINLSGVINGTRIAMQRMKPRGRGRIVNIASQAGKTGLSEGATYCATKFAVVGLSESVRRELRGSGVSVTAILPGPVKTELGAGIGNARGMAPLEPAFVANGILKSFFSKEAEVWLPQVARTLSIPASMLPTAGRDWLVRVLDGDRVLAGADQARRAEYEKNALRES